MVAGTGSIVIWKNLTLKYVLLVPNLTCKLLSISKITKDLNYVTKSFPTYCEFQELDSEKMIVNAKECVRLYILKIDDSLEEQTQNASCVFTPTLVNQSNRDFYLSR